MLLSKRSDARVKSLAPIERDDWPGPPEPAAAYPELCLYFLIVILFACSDCICVVF